LVSRTTADGGRHWVRGGCVPAAAPLAVGIHDTSHFLAVSFASGRFLAFVSADSGLTWRAQ